MGNNIRSANILDATESIDIPVFKGQRVSIVHKNFVKEMISDYKEYGEIDNVIFYGEYQHMFYYITQTKPLYKYPYIYDEQSEDYLVKMIEATNPVLFFGTDKIPKSVYTVMLNKGYSKCKTTKYWNIYKIIPKQL